MHGKGTLVNFIAFVGFFLFGQMAYSHGQEGTSLEPWDSTKHKTEKEFAGKEKFDAGKLIIEHVTDNHEWHIVTLGRTHITIPLPVILYYDGHLYSFWSNRFHNPEHAYRGFVIQEDSPDRGKIIRAGIHNPGVAILPVYDFSITKTVFAVLFSSLLLILIFISVANTYKSTPDKAPKGLQNAMEVIILFIRDDIAKSSIGEKRYEKYVPYLLTIFFFIFFNNLLGIIPLFPGGANVTGNIAVTGVMAACTLVITTFSANRHYWIDIINTPGVPWWLKLPVPLMPVVEFIGVLTKPFVLMVRLFANMLAGHIIILGFISIIFIFGGMAVALGYGVSIVSLAFMVFMDLLEILVALIQAYVFTLLSALYFGLAIGEPKHH
ncbi:MAG: F0F1 ATP synthase subunit A [Bacteroidetes bacterium]|nr:F0F1 ATP synthase subunit A [Bacteroidota bacterium]